MDRHVEYYLSILNALPMPVFVLDSDVRVVDINQAALNFFGLQKEPALMQRGGDVLHCLYSKDVPAGCGRGPECDNCIVRNTVLTSLGGKTVTRRRMKFQTRKNSHVDSVDFLVTGSPVSYADNTYVLLILEDVTELSLLKSLVPICMHCKKVRDDKQYWQQVESYFHEFLGLDFSHGICPDCMDKLYPEHKRPKKTSK